MGGGSWYHLDKGTSAGFGDPDSRTREAANVSARVQCGGPARRQAKAEVVANIHASIKERCSQSPSKAHGP